MIIPLASTGHDGNQLISIFIKSPLEGGGGAMTAGSNLTDRSKLGQAKR